MGAFMQSLVTKYILFSTGYRVHTCILMCSFSNTGKCCFNHMQITSTPNKVILLSTAHIHVYLCACFLILGNQCCFNLNPKQGYKFAQCHFIACTDMLCTGVCVTNSHHQRSHPVNKGGNNSMKWFYICGCQRFNLPLFHCHHIHSIKCTAFLENLKWLN